MATSSRILAVLALCCAGLSSLRCSARAGYDSESHFLCTRDSDCASLGSEAKCIAQRCAASTTDRDAGQKSAEMPTGDAGPLAPSPLVGLASDGTGGFRFVHVDPTTGKTTMDLPMPDVASVVPGESAFDPASQRWFTLVGIGAPTANHLVTIDARAGAIVAEPMVDARVSGIAFVQGGIVALDGTPTNGTFDFGTLAPDTGAFSTRSTLQVTSVTQGGVRADPAKGVYYILMDTIDLSTDRSVYGLRTVDVASGAVVSDVQPDQFLSAIEIDRTGQVLGLVDDGGQNMLVRVNTATGATTIVEGLQPVFGIATGGSAIDRDAGIIYQTVSTSQTSGPSLLAIDLASGLTTITPLSVELDSFAVCSPCRTN